MTNEEINIAIAESLGLIRHPNSDWKRHGVQIWFEKDGETRCKLPNYAADLNACHEFEKALDEMLAVHIRGVGVCTKAEIYYDMLGGLCDQPVRATARQRCEAYLRTIGKWKE